MRTLFVESKCKKTALKQAPWASIIIKVQDGFMCFESYDDYFNFKNQK